MTRARDLNPVRLRREEQGLLLKELADQLPNISAPLLSMIEGGFCPRVPAQRTIADALNTTPEQLWPEEYA